MERLLKLRRRRRAAEGRKIWDASAERRAGMGCLDVPWPIYLCRLGHPGSVTVMFGLAGWLAPAPRGRCCVQCLRVPAPRGFADLGAAIIDSDGYDCGLRLTSRRCRRQKQLNCREGDSKLIEETSNHKTSPPCTPAEHWPADAAAVVPVGSICCHGDVVRFHRI